MEFKQSTKKKNDYNLSLVIIDQLTIIDTCKR